MSGLYKIIVGIAVIAMNIPMISARWAGGQPLSFDWQSLAKPSRKHENSEVSFVTFRGIIADSSALLRSKMSTAKWLGPSFLYNAAVFNPFLKRMILEEGDRLYIHGDLHGDIHSLGKFLNDLRKKKVIDKNLKLKNPTDHILFLGDFVDRGEYGIEVLALVFKLYLLNPDRVLITRGNHEDLSLNSQDGEFLSQIRRFCAKQKVASEACPDLVVELDKLYAHLPVAYFIKSPQMARWIMAAHGGFEPGYDPKSLLAAESDELYQLVGPLDRKAFLEASQLDQTGRHPIWSFQGWMSQPNEVIDQKWTNSLGFMWNDFTLQPEEQDSYLLGRGFRLSQKTSHIYMKKGVGVLLRAHQHSEETMPLLIRQAGVLNHWQSGVADKRQYSLAKEQVFTFSVSPSALYKAAFGLQFGTYGFVELKDSLEDTVLEVMNYF